MVTLEDYGFNNFALVFTDKSGGTTSIRLDTRDESIARDYLFDVEECIGAHILELQKDW